MAAQGTQGAQIQSRRDRFESSDSDTEDRTNKSSPNSSQDTRQRFVTSQFNSSGHRESIGGPNRPWQQKPPFFEFLPRICFMAVFILCVVAATYAMRHRDVFLSWFPSSESVSKYLPGAESDDVLLICSNGETEGCCQKDMVCQLPHFVRKLFESLNSKKGQALCGDGRPSNNFITVADLQSLLYKNISHTNVELLLECCLQHILINPHWKIRALQKDGTVATNKDDIVRLESEVSMSMLCRLWSYCLGVKYKWYITAAVCVLLALFVRYKLKQKEEERKKVPLIIDDIIELLQDHYAKTQGNDPEYTYLAVQYVRDLFIPPSRRQELQRLWDKAVAFIAANESRVQMETRLIWGRHCKVWRWLQPPVPHTNSQKSSGLAGDRDDTDSQNPTVCLKIRSTNVLHFEDEVIDECNYKTSIVYDYYGEGPLYLKFNNLEAAINARNQILLRSLEGDIFTVKYVKPFRYHMMFPDARFATEPLYP